MTFLNSPDLVNRKMDVEKELAAFGFVRMKGVQPAVILTNPGSRKLLVQVWIHLSGDVSHAGAFYDATEGFEFPKFLEWWEKQTQDYLADRERTEVMGDEL